MARTLGIDIRKNSVRVALVRTSYRRVYLEALSEVDRSSFETLEDALREAASGYMQHHEGVAMALSGEQVYIHRVALPPAALKRVADVLPFELEAQIPIDFDELVFDSRVLPRDKHADNIEVLAAAAETSTVRSIIDLGQRALGHEPERVAVGPLAIGNLAALCPELRQPRYIAVVDLGDLRSELVILHEGVTVAARTLSIGVAGLPGNAKQMVSALKQSIISWAATSEHPVEVVYLCGGGAAAHGIHEYLTAHVGVSVEDLPKLHFEGVTEGNEQHVSRFAKAIGIALGMRAGQKDLDLRQGELTYQHGFGFLQEKIPLAIGLGAVLLVSFLFSTWAEGRALDAENAALTEAMTGLSKEILQEETDDVDRVLDLLEAGGKAEKDPQPEQDGFDLILALTKNVPPGVKHEVEELDLTRDHVKLRAVVESTEDAQKIADNFKQDPCYKDVKIEKITAVPNKDLQKYSMDFQVRCEEEKKPAKSSDGEESDDAEGEEE